MSDSIYLVNAGRTPMGSFQGTLSSLPAPALGATAIKSAVAKSNLKAADIQLCVMGHVLSAGAGQAPARQAAMGAGLPASTPAITINKVCGSGLEAVVLAGRAMLLGETDIAIAGGMESMSNAPYLLPEARGGMRMGHKQAMDSMVHDGLWDPYNDVHMGNCAERCAAKYGFTRSRQDAFAVESYRRARAAVSRGWFQEEIAPVDVHHKRKTIRIDTDEEPGRADLDKMSELRPAFEKHGTVTAGNASSINDGAAAVVLATESKVKALGLAPMARILSWGHAAQEPEWFTTAPAPAMRHALARAKLSIHDIDLWEINEAFSVVTMAAMQTLGVPHDRVNIHGGAVALGHPIGASGCRLLVTLLHALKRRRKTRGMVSLCIGGGEGIAMAVERLDAS